MPPKKAPKNQQAHPNRATNDPSEAESENPRERQIPENTNRARDMVLSRHNHKGGRNHPEDVAEGNFVVSLVDVGVEDEDIASLRRIEERLARTMRERTMSANIRTRSQAEAANLMVKEIQNEDPAQEKAKYNEMLQQVMKKRLLLQQLQEDEEQQAIRRKTLQLQEKLALLKAQLNSLQHQEQTQQPHKMQGQSKNAKTHNH
jgi:hypothetical protein